MNLGDFRSALSLRRLAVDRRRGDMGIEPVRDQGRLPAANVGRGGAGFQDAIPLRRVVAFDRCRNARARS